MNVKYPDENDKNKKFAWQKDVNELRQFFSVQFLNFQNSSNSFQSKQIISRPIRLNFSVEFVNVMSHG